MELVAVPGFGFLPLESHRTIETAFKVSMPSIDKLQQFISMLFYRCGGFHHRIFHHRTFSPPRISPPKIFTTKLFSPPNFFTTELISPPKFFVTEFFATEFFATEFHFHHLYHQTFPIFVEPFPKVQYK